MPERRPFTLVIKSTGQRLEVPAGASALRVLELNGFRIDYDCRNGTCARCKTRVLAGEVDHWDGILRDRERAEGWFTPCCSRAAGDELVLDL